MASHSKGKGSREQGAGEAWEEEEEGKIRKKIRLTTMAHCVPLPHDPVEPMEVD